MHDYNWDILKAVAIVALPTAGRVIASNITNDHNWSYSDWYEQLKKPRFTPPKWVFPVVWTGLYGSMGYASYLVYRAGVTRGADVTLPLAVYGSQLLVNWSWSPIFFNCKNYGLATASIFTMLGGTAATAILFHSIDRTASYLMLPCVAWLTLASAITYSIWRNNPPAEPKYLRTFFGHPVEASKNR